VQLAGAYAAGRTQPADLQSSRLSYPVTDSPLEVLCRQLPRTGIRAALFDFDGTLSLLRRNWQDVMIPMMVEELSKTPQAEPREQLGGFVEEYVMRLNGKQTIYQMIRLAEEIQLRGGSPRAPLEYKEMYHDLLWQAVGERVGAVESGEIPAEEMTVPGSLPLLERLRDAGIALYMASGTDLHYVKREAQLLGVAEFFGEHIYGALDDFKQFSKAQTIRSLVEEQGFSGGELIGFGDGFVEIEELAKVGGLAIGVASNEDTRRGVNQWKRERLIKAGADVIVADYRNLDDLCRAVGIPDQASC